MQTRIAEVRADNRSTIQARFVSLLDAFLLSRRVENCRAKTIAHYAYGEASPT